MSRGELGSRRKKSVPRLQREKRQKLPSKLAIQKKRSSRKNGS